MALSERLAIIITCNGAGAIAEFRKVEGAAARSVGKAETTAGKFKANASRIGAGMLIVGAAVAAGMHSALVEASEAAKVGRQTEAVIKSTGGSANVTKAHLEELAGSLSRVAAVDDEVIQSAGNVLLTFKSVANQTGENADIFDRAMESALDMSAALGTDLQSSVLALGKALSNPVQGLQALRRAGVDFTQQQRDQVAAMVAVGDTLGAQQLIMAEVESQFDGQAEAGATALDQLSVGWGNLLEAIGTPIQDSGVIDWWAKNWEDPMTRLGAAWDEVERGFTGADMKIEWNGETLSNMARELGIAKQELDGIAKSGGDAAAAVEELSEAIDIYLGQQFDVPEATREAGESFAEMITKFTDGESTWADQAAAQQEYVTGVAGVVTAMSEQGASQQAVDNALRSNIGSLRAARDAGQITGEQFVTLRDQILGIPHGHETRVTTPGAREALQAARDLKMSIELVPIKKSVPVRLEGAQQALGEAWGIKDRLEAIPKSTTVWVNIKTTGSAKISARGGPLGAGELSIVGEEGPEMFVPNTGGNIIPAMQTAKLMMGGGGPGPAPVGGSASAGIVVNIHGSATKADGQAVVDALRRWQQRNGPVPVRVNG